MDGDYEKLVAYIVENLCYKKDEYQSYIYHIDYENSHVGVYCGGENINDEVMQYLQNNRKNLFAMVAISERV